MMKKKKQSRSQSSSTLKNPQKILEEQPSFDSSPSPRLLSAFRSKLTSGKDLKHMFRNMRKKPVPGLSSQARIVRCPNCHKLLQEPLNAPAYKCGQCNSVLQARRWKLEGKAASNIDETDAVQINENSLPETLHRSYRTDDESAGGGSKSPIRRTYRELNSRASPSIERGYHSETVYKDEASNVRREWIRRADEFSVPGDSDMFASARSSPYRAGSNGVDRDWTQEEERYENLPRAPFYPASPSPSSSSAYEYGNSPYHRSYVTSSEQSYYHQQPNHFKQYGREGWFQESSVTSSVHFPGEISDGKYYQWSAQSSHHDLQYHNLYESSSSLAATSHRSVNSELLYQAAAAAPHLSPYSDQRYPIRNSKTETSSEKGTNRYIKEKNPMIKRHVLPSGGAAPFATCNYCLELLQLPQGSSHGKHKRFIVRCGSCSGVLKFSLQEKAVHDTPRFLDSSTGFPEETIDNNHQDGQDSASEGHKEICPDQYSQSFSEAQSEKSTEIIKNICERDERNLEESGYEKYGILEPGKMAGDGSGEPLEVSRHKKEKMSESSEEAEMLEERSVYNSVKALNKNEYVCEAREPATDTRETHKSDWEETQENEEHGREKIWEEIMEDKQRLHLEGSQYCRGSVSDSNSSDAEVVCSKTVQEAAKEDTDHISNKFSDAMSVKPQSPVKSLADENQRFIEQPDESSEARFVISRIHGEQSSDAKSEHSQYEHKNSGERQELEKTISDQVRYELEECRYKTNETLEPGKVVEDEYFGFLDKASDEAAIEGVTGKERLVSHQIEPQNQNEENSHGTLEPVYLEASVYAGERSWGEKMEDRAGLHLEEYERNYEAYIKPFEWNSERAPTFRLHVHELEAKFEPEEDADGRSESSSRGSFNDQDSSNERAVVHESQDTKTEQSEYEFENSVRVRSELEECRHERNETHEPDKLVGDEPIVAPKTTSDTIIGETGVNRLASNQMEPQNGNVEESCRTLEPVYLEGKGYTSERSLEWTSERAPTFHLHEYQLEEMLEPEEDGRLERVVFHEEEPWLLDEALKVGIMEEDEHLEKNEAMNSEETFEWTSERAPTFRLYEYELGTMLEPDEDVDDRSESSSRGNESLKERDVFQEEEPRLVDDKKTEALEVCEKTEDVPPLNLEECKNQSMKMNETFDWTSERALTFRLQAYELETMVEPEEDTDEISESSSRDDNKTEAIKVSVIAEDGSSLQLDKSEKETMEMEGNFEWTAERALTFRLQEYELEKTLKPEEDTDGRSELYSSMISFRNHGSVKEKVQLHEEDPQLVDDNKTETLKESKIAEDAPSLHLEKCKDETKKLDEKLEQLCLDDTLEQERMISHSEKSQDKQENLRQTLELEKPEEDIDIPTSTSRVFSEDIDSSTKMAKLVTKADKERLKGHLEHVQKKNEKQELTCETYPQFYSTTEPSEIVGLRHALYQTQNSPLRSPLTSPNHTPVGSPLHYLMSSQVRSPIASSMSSHIVSPLRSPITSSSSGSLSDVLFFGKKDR